MLVTMMASRLSFRESASVTRPPVLHMFTCAQRFWCKQGGKDALLPEMMMLSCHVTSALRGHSVLSDCCNHVMSHLASPIGCTGFRAISCCHNQSEPPQPITASGDSQHPAECEGSRRSCKISVCGCVVLHTGYVHTSRRRSTGKLTHMQLTAINGNTSHCTVSVGLVCQLPDQAETILIVTNSTKPASHLKIVCSVYKACTTPTSCTLRIWPPASYR